MTRAHVRIAVEAADAIGAQLVVVPAARSPHKDTGPQATDEQRAEMLRIAFGDRAAVWEDELERGGASYWLETLERFAGAHPGCRARFLIGADQVAALHRWRGPREIVALAPPVLVPRPGEDSSIDELLRTSGFWTEAELASFTVLNLEPVDISSTAVRGALGSGDRKTAESVLDPAVLEFIEANGLYRRANA